MQTVLKNSKSGHWHKRSKMRDCPANSTDRCNTLRKLLRWRLILQGLSRAFIQLSGNRAQLGLAMYRQISAFWKILPQQAVGIFVWAALPRAVWVTKVDVDIGCPREVFVPRHLGSTIPCKRSVEFFGKLVRLLD